MRGYDYSRSGDYFVTICTFNKECVLGRIVDGEMQLSACGRLAYDEWSRSGQIRREVELDVFVVMPNHVHGIVRIVGADGVRP